ncbi:hypothetical protein HK105_205656 [Polyrhizophydium stewartii]|uniref:Ankyrin repeat protein n=1 Tax=Polyrhizophydium stewartii TaxID=2732419 RepID=A0ABR4N5E5_9FUNG
MQQPGDDESEPPAAPSAAEDVQALRAAVLSLSHGLESLRRQLDEQHAAGEALRAELAAQSDTNKALLSENEAQRSRLAQLEAELQAQRLKLYRTETLLEAQNVSLDALQGGIKSFSDDFMQRLTVIETKMSLAFGFLDTLRPKLELIVQSGSFRSLMVGSGQPSTVPGREPAPEAEPKPVPSAEDAAALESAQEEQPEAAAAAAPAGLGFHWDRLPADLQQRIIAKAGLLTQLANGMVHPVELACLDRGKCLDLWADVIAAEWDGDLSLLPKVRRSNNRLLAIRSRGMLARVRALGTLDATTEVQIALRNRWDDLLAASDPQDVALAAAAEGDLALLRHLVDDCIAAPTVTMLAQAVGSGSMETAKFVHGRLGPIQLNDDLSIQAVNSGSLDMMVWLREACGVRISALALGLAAHQRDLAMCRWIAAHCDESDASVFMYQLGLMGDVEAFSTLHARFGSTVDFQETLLTLSDRGLIEWAHENGLVADLSRMIDTVVRFDCPETVAWLCRDCGAVLHQSHFITASRSNNARLVAWMLGRPDIRIDGESIELAVRHGCIDVIKAMVAHNPRVAALIVNKAVVTSQIVHDMEKPGVAPPPTPAMLVDWLAWRYPEGFTQRTLILAVDAAMASGDASIVQKLFEAFPSQKWSLSPLSAFLLVHDGNKEHRDVLMRLVHKHHQKQEADKRAAAAQPQQ